jgi:hypothetical protein
MSKGLFRGIFDPFLHHGMHLEAIARDLAHAECRDLPGKHPHPTDSKYRFNEPVRASLAACTTRNRQSPGQRSSKTYAQSQQWRLK